MDDPNQATYAELEIEKQLQQSDVFVHRYLQLIGEYGELPDCDDIIMPLLTNEFGKETVDQMLGDAPWEDDDSDMLPLDETEDRKGGFMENDGRKQSPLEENSGKAASLIASSLLGWCNINPLSSQQDVLLPPAGLRCPGGRRLHQGHRPYPTLQTVLKMGAATPEGFRRHRTQFGKSFRQYHRMPGRQRRTAQRHYSRISADRPRRPPVLKRFTEQTAC